MGTRARIALSIPLVIALICGAFVLRRGDAPADAAQPSAPQFLTWEGEPYADGLNHFVVQVEPYSASANRLLEMGPDGLLRAVADLPAALSPAELEAALAGASADTTIDVAGIVAELRSLPGVTGARHVGFGIVAVAGDTDAPTLEAQPGVVRVAVDGGLTAASFDELYPTQWALENDGSSPEGWMLEDDADIDAPEGWHRTRGAGVVVAVIDSGADVDHPDLAANVWHNADESCGNGIDDDGNGYVDDCAGWDFAAQDPTVDDVNGHGTHVAGIIAAEANNGIGIAGVAYESQVMVLKVGDQTPALSSAIEAISYAIDNGARIINASWIVEDEAAEAYLDPALDAAEAAGVLVVVGAGNDGADIDTRPIYPATAPHDNVITVGASTPVDQPAEYSGFGAAGVDLFAPGEQIVSTLPGGGYGAYSGTSMAAPMVSGAAALLWAATPEASYAEVKGALLDRSDGPNDGVDAFRGLAVSDGRLNVERAIYTHLFRPSLMFTFHDFNSFAPDQLHDVTVQAQTIDPWIAPPQTPAQYRAGLYVPLDGMPAAVVGHEIRHPTGTAVTDGTGRAVVGAVWERENRPVLVQDGDFTPLQMSLPAGTYAFVTEVVDVTDPAAPVRMGDPSAVFFIVSADGSVAEMPATPLAGLPPTPPPATTVPATTVTTGPAPVTTTTAGPATVTTITTSTTAAAWPSATTTTSSTTTTTSTAPGEPAATTATTSTTVPPTTTTMPATTTTTLPAEPSGSGAGAATSTTSTTSTTSSTSTTVPAGMRISGVDPSQGPRLGGNLVSISGVELPEDPTVWFGERKAAIISVAAPTFIVVEAPTSEPGYVDVVVVDRATGDEAVYERGYRYLEDAGALSTTTTTTTTSLPTTVTTSPPPSTTTSAPAGAPTPTDGGLDGWLDGLLITPDGLTLAPVAPDDPIALIPVQAWVGELCDEPVCPGWVLEH